MHGSVRPSDPHRPLWPAGRGRVVATALVAAAAAGSVTAVPTLTSVAIGGPATGSRSPQPVAVTSPRSLYVLHCAGCHAMDASGHPDKGVPSMRGMLGRFMQLPEGRAFLVQVPGVNNAGLTDAQIAELTNWTVRSFSADTAPPGWAPYTADEVTEAKRHRPLDVAKKRAELVERLPPPR